MKKSRSNMWMKKETCQKQSLISNENGFAAFFVTLVLLIIFSLTSLGFAQLSRNEQSNALNKQLSLEAQYAAESEVNNAVQDIENGYIGPSAEQDSNYPITLKSTYATASDSSCMNSSMPIGSDSHISTPLNGTGVHYSCLLVNLVPPTLTANDIIEGSSWHQIFSTASPLSSLTINWSGTTPNQNNYPTNAASSKLPAYSQWHNAGYAPIVELSISPIGTGSLSRQNLVNQTLTVFLYPSQSGNQNSINYQTDISAYNSSASASDGQYIGSCSSSSGCSATITGLDSADGSNSTFEGPFLVTATSYYGSANLSLHDNNGTGGSGFTNSQAVIDATGQAQNVEKRLVETIALPDTGNTSSYLPSDSIESEDTCKLFQTLPNETDFYGSSVGTNPTNDPCNLDD
jgi:hypothetical protein